MNFDHDSFRKDCPSEGSAAQEAQRLQDLQGPGIVALHGRGHSRELVLAGAACSLADVLHERGPLPDDEIRAVGAATAAALARVHDAGLVHGDIKPANLLLSRSGELLLADFDGASPADGRRLRCFSPPRLPPGTPARPATDILAVAITLVELSTGTLIDPRVSWYPWDLRRLGCSPGLSAEISFMLGHQGSTPSAQRVAEMFQRCGPGVLPEPAAEARCVDPTPTVEFMPARHPEPDASPPFTSGAQARPPRWWQRLAASWRPRGAASRAASQSQDQASGSSQAIRSS